MFDLVFIFLFILLLCFFIFRGFLFLYFLAVFYDFFNFSTIFFAGFCFAFTHQNGYNFGKSLAILFFWIILLGVDGVTRNKSPVGSLRLQTCSLTVTCKSIKKYKNVALGFSKRLRLQVARLQLMF